MSEGTHPPTTLPKWQTITRYTIEKINEKTIQSCGTFSIAIELILFFILCTYLYLVAGKTSNLIASITT